jgi:hypothetical protein
LSAQSHLTYPTALAPILAFAPRVADFARHFPVLAFAFLPRQLTRSSGFLCVRRWRADTASRWLSLHQLHHCIPQNVAGSVLATLNWE